MLPWILKVFYGGLKRHLKHFCVLIRISDSPQHRIVTENGVVKQVKILKQIYVLLFVIFFQVQPCPAAVSRARADLPIGRDGRRQPSQNRSAFSSRKKFNVRLSFSVIQRFSLVYNVIFNWQIFLFSFIQYCFICRPSDSIVSEDAGIEPRTRIFILLWSLRIISRNQFCQPMYLAGRNDNPIPTRFLALKIVYKFQHRTVATLALAVRRSNHSTGF